MASDAIAKMGAPVDDTDCNDFIEECRIQGRPVLSVVDYVAKSENIDLCGDAPKDEAKRKIYELLNRVLKKYVSDSIVRFVQLNPERGMPNTSMWPSVIKPIVKPLQYPIYPSSSQGFRNAEFPFITGVMYAH